LSPFTSLQAAMSVHSPNRGTSATNHNDMKLPA
jgi:hypothetical protein